MRLLRHGSPGAEKPGLMTPDGSIRDLSARLPELTPGALDPACLKRLAGLDPDSLPPVMGAPRLGVPLVGIGNILCIGLNYRDHAAETGLPPPAEPILFSKHTSALSGPCDAIRLAPGSTRTDWEVELAVIIGRPARRVSEAQALDHVAAYAVLNDVSERSFQIDRGGQWIKGKSCDTYCPLGPWLTTADEVPDPQSLGLWLSVDGEMRQNGQTGDMIFGVAELIAYVSRFMTLKPGDVLATGTPAGVGMGRGEYLRPGQTVRLGIDGPDGLTLGQMTLPVEATPED
ncbi:fumarylacetoacetate hydrolase family protein [Roseospirillum parvum]|uniref:Ureidoglycolate lyase n=1 Tax=Roseospirillum parvum TaxID=83401 RepID=A0A1G7WAP1_9PROT|nr:fumarylacetoacetate hydrolase family protein [Roseospirillum parvum]SDG68899.1 ureidoglycolate lyase [Roseospirillum parvum]